MDCCYIGIDLGSTTTKAVFLDEQERIMGRGITNSRSNYELACQVAREEAEINARFGLLRRTLEASERIGTLAEPLMAVLACNHALAQHLEQLQALDAECRACAQAHDLPAAEQASVGAGARNAFSRRCARRPSSTSSPAAPPPATSSATSPPATTCNRPSGSPASCRCRSTAWSGCSTPPSSGSRTTASPASTASTSPSPPGACCADERFAPFADEIAAAVSETAERRFNVLNTVGTGYGRLTLPFAREQIRSEILCHGLGAHYMFPDTRTVLDIGGQDTKAIQIDGNGIVTGFQMNDRCAAGCGRYLGYIADEMSIGVHELGPLALQSTKPVKINSTCTVFAGAELRELMALGEKREDILAGLHRAIVLRAMSLLARSGGVDSEFTFTGGVARNQAVTGALEHLVFENYGKMTINISADSIFTGAVGAALFAKRDPKGVMSDLEVSKLPGSKACGLAAACPA